MYELPLLLVFHYNSEHLEIILNMTSVQKITLQLSFTLLLKKNKDLKIIPYTSCDVSVSMLHCVDCFTTGIEFDNLLTFCPYFVLLELQLHSSLKHILWKRHRSMLINFQR